MIAHVIGRRQSFGRVLGYLAGPGRNGEHVEPRVVAADRDAGVFVGEALDQDSARFAAEHLDSTRVAFQSRVREPALHVTLSFNEATTPEQRTAVYEAYVERMGCFDRSAWVAVEHGRSHVREENGALKGGHEHGHLVISLVRDDGKAVRLGKHKERSQEVAQGIERDYGLKVLESRELGIGEPGYHGAEKAIAERLHGKGTDPARFYIATHVRAAHAEAGSEREFVRILRDRGVKVSVARFAPGSQRVAAYQYAVKDSATYSGGRLGRDLTTPRLRQKWAGTAPDTADQAAHRAAGQLASVSVARERGEGPIARESRELGRFAQTRAGIALALTSAASEALKERVRRAERERQLDEQAQYRGRSTDRSRDNGIGL